MHGLLRICTSGSVDDGKSTLIGRLLHDSRGFYEDQVRSVQSASRHRGVGDIDYSLFTDGLRAEREQGITIDVAYRYFATARRKFILADTPGHEQYTRNMATGASTADVTILLVDARHGRRRQSERHARIAQLLGVREFIVAVNKMDLVQYDEARFQAVARDFDALLDTTHVHYVPVSALEGDNITTRSTRTAWYDGPSLIELLETIEPQTAATAAPFRLPVQLVLRPGSDFRGYAGRIASGAIAVGDVVSVYPSGRSTTVTRIVTRDGDLARAEAPLSVVLTLRDELDISRGDVIGVGAPLQSDRLNAQIVWMDERSLDPTRRYLIKHGTRTVRATFGSSLELNEIATVQVRLLQRLAFDSYADNRATGSFIIIDADTNFTAGAGMITSSLEVIAS